MKKKTFLVTGGTGFIGSSISKLLVEKNYNVKIFDNNSRGSISKIKNFNKKIKFIKGDIRNQELLNKALKNADAVIHLAWQGIPDYSESISRVNLNNTIDLFDFI